MEVLSRVQLFTQAISLCSMDVVAIILPWLLRLNERDKTVFNIDGAQRKTFMHEQPAWWAGFGEIKWIPHHFYTRKIMALHYLHYLNK